MKKESGQALLLISLIFAVLVFATAIIIVRNRISTHHSVFSQQKGKGLAASHQGLHFAVQQLSSYTVVLSTPWSSNQTGPGVNGGNFDATFRTQNVPVKMEPADAMYVSLTFDNPVGATAWPSTYRLVPVNSPSWATFPTLVEVDPLGVATVPAGSRKSFMYQLTAPSGAGFYQFQWGLNDTTANFGQYSKNVTVRVEAFNATPAPNWPHFGGVLPPAATYSGIQGSTFSVVYSTGTAMGLQSYQVGIFTQHLDKAGNPMPGTKLKSHVSAKTVSAKLPSGYSASAALQLAMQPIYGANSVLTLYWGPVVSYSTWTFNVGDWMDGFGSPRKFAVNGITGNYWPRSESGGAATDQKEYWAYNEIGFPLPIDLHWYRRKAQNSTNVGATGLPAGWSCVGTGTCTHWNSSGYFFVTAGSTMVVTGSSGDWNPGWASDNENVLFIDGGQNGSGGGNVEFKNIAIDVKNRGAVIVTGNMIIGQRADNSGLNISSTRVPLTARLEIPYDTTGTWFCYGYEGADCPTSAWTGTSPTRPTIRGFVYVMGNMQVMVHQGPSTGTFSTILGTLRVDGELRLDPSATLVIPMDAEINHAIRTTPFELQIDSMTYVP